MNVEIKGIHLEVTKNIQDYLDAKMPRLDFAKELIVDFMLTLTREKNLFKVEATVNFRWGASMHLGVESFDLNKGIDEFFDKLEAKIEKEKSKIKDHHKKKEILKEEE
jgi:putative sigma-54 modulation protein